MLGLSLVVEGRAVAWRKCNKIWLVLEGRGFDADLIHRAVARPRGTRGLACSSQKDEGLVLEGRGFRSQHMNWTPARQRGTAFRC